MAKKNKLTGVILAAGKGTRMLPFSTKYPKPLLPVANKPLIYYQIESMLNMGIKDIVIVISHLGYEIASRIGDGSSLGARIKYVEQQETLGIAHAVGQLEPHISSAFFLFLGDIFFIADDLDLMRIKYEDSNTEAVLAVKEEPDEKAIMKNFSVILDKDGMAKRVIEKPRYIHNNLKGCGIYLFGETIFDAIRRTPRTAMRDEYELTESIQIMIEDGLSVTTASVIKKDINLTTPLDLLNCNLQMISGSDSKNVIGTNTSIHDGAEISNSVIGNNVIISEPAAISDSVVFSNARIESDGALNEVVVTPDVVVDCSTFKFT